MNDLRDRGCGGGQKRGVGGSGCAEVFRDGKKEACPKAVVEGLHYDSWFSADPASVEAESIAVSHDRRGLEIDLGPVGFVIAVAVGNEIEFPCIHEAGPVRALTNPSGSA